MNKVSPIMGEPFDVTKLEEEVSALANDATGKGPRRIRLPRGSEGQSHSEGVAPQPQHDQGAVTEAIAEDPINPSHYRRHPSGIECIEVTRHMNFNVGNAIKYLWRYMDKGDPVENLKKAQWYLDDEIRRLGGK